jgi:hypothetical protein
MSTKGEKGKRGFHEIKVFFYANCRLFIRHLFHKTGGNYNEADKQDVYIWDLRP